ncbi:Polymer-forming cytoskeletal [Sodalis glossinidius str. 'morsitans']|uniref:Polymer-forming cytoskeletal n=1 Tax=Sodalis glossinidius (strain morsitans) TaxID=343509 RepID=A0A193QMA2_SODGM|nr:polymer-forming cytoskeletal protein [Sodalis glossinidius]CRL46055.1 Polymer-forming cytoskeletal [Sodalis glossinidius str. 'morsitans']
MNRKTKRRCPDGLCLNGVWAGWILALAAYLTDKTLLCAAAACAALGLLGLYFVKTRVGNRTMFGKKMPAQASLPPEPAPMPAGASPRLEKQHATLIAKSAVFTGDIDIEGDIHIWGKITGNIRVKEGAIHVMHAGQVEGELLAPEIIIDGKVEGTCCATTLDILEHGELHGVSRCAGMTIQRGGQFVGQSESGEPLSLQSGTQDALSRRRGTSHDSKGASHENSGDPRDGSGTHASSGVRQDRRAREDRPKISPAPATHDGKATAE